MISSFALLVTGSALASAFEKLPHDFVIGKTTSREVSAKATVCAYFHASYNNTCMEYELDGFTVQMSTSGVMIGLKFTAWLEKFNKLPIWWRATGLKMATKTVVGANRQQLVQVLTNNGGIIDEDYSNTNNVIAYFGHYKFHFYIANPRSLNVADRSGQELVQLTITEGY